MEHPDGRFPGQLSGGVVTVTLNPTTPCNPLYPPPIWGRTRLANSRTDPVVVVTLTYRLGILGFLGGDAVAASTRDGSAGNFGLQDQRLALRWVKQHVAAFGGDPARVFLFGVSTAAAASTVLSGACNGGRPYGGGERVSARVVRSVCARQE